MQESSYGISGLNTSPNPVNAVPPGALSAADNVVIRRPGMVEPRPGFKLESGQAADALTSIWKILPYDDSYLRVGYTGSVIKSVWKNGTAVAAIQDKWDPFTIRGVEARKNFYITTSDATRKLTAANDTTAGYAGLQPMLVIIPNGTAGSAIPAGETRAYRYTISRTDANGVVVTSAPSSRGILTNDTGGSQNGSVVARFGTTLGIVAGDVVKLYGSWSSVTSAPSDELFYITSVTLGASDITSGGVSLTDAVVNVDLGEALYTNATQQGIKRANNMPPLAKDLALFGGSLFAGNITWPHALAVNWRTRHTGLVATDVTHIGVRSINGVRTNGSATITAIADTSGMKVGMMLVTPANWSGSIPVVITTVAANSITMNATWGGATDGGGVNISIGDSIRIKNGSEDQYYPAYSAADLGLALTQANATQRTSPSAYTTVQFYADSVFYIASTNVPVDDQLLQAQFLQLLPSSAGFQIWATNGALYDPVLPEPSVASGKASVQDTFPNGLTWSKQDEPEHFIRSTLWLVGNAKAPIVRIVPLLDGLLIFKGKGDGIYMLTGYGELSGWSVREIDPTTYLLHPELVTKLEDAAYAWTNTGMCRVDSGGQTMLSGPIMNLTEDSERTLNPNATTMAFANAVGNLPDHEVIFSLPNTVTNKAAPAATYVYNTFTNAWTQWFGADGSTTNALAFDNSVSSILRGPSDDGIVRVSKWGASQVFPVADLEYSVTISAITGLNITINAGSGWTPAVGDSLRRLSVFATVTAVTDPTHFTVNQAPASTGAATAAVAFRSLVTWLPKLSPTGAQVKRFQSVVTHFDDVYGLYSWSITASGTRGNSSAQAYTRTKVLSHDRAEQRALFPASVGLDSQLYITLTILNGDAQWRCTGITENFEVATDRVSL